MILSTAVQTVYIMGFIVMTPQLFINYKKKSVAALPWRMLFYRTLNTFIDDLFAFVIKMPTMHRFVLLEFNTWQSLLECRLSLTIFFSRLIAWLPTACKWQTFVLPRRHCFLHLFVPGSFNEYIVKPCK